jgi:hypothetical protein
MGFLDSDRSVDLVDAFKSLWGDEAEGSADTAEATDSSSDWSWSSDDPSAGGTATAEDLFGEGWDEEATAEDAEESVAAWASRQTTDSDTQTVLDCGYELRRIILCNGIQYTRNATERGLQEHELLKSMSGQSEADRRAYAEAIGQRRSCIVPDGLQLDGANGEYRRINEFEFEYRNDLQKVLYKVLIRESKDAFIEALRTPDVMVVYSGHARYGRGPCFGLSPAPGDDWEMGADAARGGIFRMGYPIIGVHASEIAQHGYSYYPVSTDDFAITEGVPHALLHPDVHPFKIWRDRLPKHIASQALSQSPYGDTESFAGDKEVWMVPGGDPEILLWAGWRDSIGAPHELAQVELQCKAVMFFGCSTALHWKKILRDLKGWQKAEDDRYAFFTSDVSDSMLDKFWFESLLNYDQDNAHRGWSAALTHAQNASNKRLAASGETYRVVT